MAKPTEINWILGEELVKRYNDPNGRSFSRVFCCDCGCGLPFVNVTKTTLFIPAGCLDQDPGIRPEKNIFWDERAPWLEQGRDAPICPGFP